MQRYCLPSIDPDVETKINKATDVIGSASKRMNLQRTYKHNRHNTYPLQFTRCILTWRPRLSGGCSTGVEQSASTDQGRLVAVVFSAADKGPSVSAVVQLTSDYCLPSFSFKDLICKVPL